jgi:hypothetical protein
MVVPVNGEIAAVKQRGRPFKPGQSGNPLGRPKGARNRATVAAEALLEGEAEALTRKTIELALAGDPAALRLCLERILPPRKDRPLHFSLPPESGPQDPAGAMRAIVEALAAGQITPSEATAAIQVIEACRRVADAAAASDARDFPPTINIGFVRPPVEELGD